MKLTVTLSEEQIIEAITSWLKTQGYIANGEAMLLHGDNDRSMGHYYYATVDVTLEQKP